MPLVQHAEDGPFGRWAHVEWRPGAAHPLAPVVDRIWHFDGVVAPGGERVFPDGCVEIVVQLDGAGPYRVARDAGVDACPVANVGGVQTTPFTVLAPAGRSRVLGLRLRPGGAWAVLAVPVHEMDGTAIDLRAVVGRAADALVARCGDAPSAEACVRAAIAWLAARVERAPAGEAAVAWAVRALTEPSLGTPPLGAPPTIAALRARTGLSRDRFTAAFRAQVGLAPKAFARVVRFRRALAALQAADRPLSDVALDAGYYDQPHMNAEFRALAGMSPGAYAAARRYPGSANVADAPA